MAYKIYFGPGMSFFGLNAIKNFGFEQYSPFEDIYRPVLFLGLYDESDVEVFKIHRGRKAIFWNGTDVSALLANPLWQATIKSFPNVRHACHNTLLQKELALMGFEAVVAPIFFSKLDDYSISFKPSQPLQVYLVAHKGREAEYGVDVVERIAPQLSGVIFHIYGIFKPDLPNVLYHGVVPEVEMDRAIANFHVCLRLNAHDGLSQTLVKSVLLGQYAISAIDYPFCTLFENVDVLIRDLENLKSVNRANHTGRYYVYQTLNDFSWLEKRPNDIALVMTVKNEGLGLEKAILSCIDFVDQIVISVDSKSTDDTLQIAQKYADVVKIHDWEDDFSKARNFAQEGVKTDWILILDGHEFVESAPDIYEKLKQDCDGLLTYVVMETGFAFFYPRIFRTGLKFDGAVHNLVIPKNSKKYKDFVIKHDRTNSQAPFAIAQRNEQRDKMILSIMGDRVKKNPKDSRALFYMGVFYLNAQDFKTTIWYFKRYLKYSTNAGERYTACFNIAWCFYMSKKYTKALKYLRLADIEEPGRWETIKFSGMCYMAFEQWGKALPMLIESFKTHSRDFAYNPWPVDFGDTWYMISVCFIALRKFKEGRLACEEALKTLQNPEQRSEVETRLKLLARIDEAE